MIDDRGAGTTFTASLVFVLITVGTLGMAAVQAHLVAGRTQAAADMAALAGARATGDPCGRASAVARANGGELVDCFVQDGDLLVTVASRSPSLLSKVTALIDHGTDRVWATSRAG